MSPKDWTDRAALEAWLHDQTSRDDASLDLAPMALALAALGPKGGDPRPALEHLAAMVAEARHSLPEPSPALVDRVATLNTLLFGRHGYEGDQANYDDLDNADLIRVIERRRGLPVALAIVYLHVAQSLGWAAEGVNFPGHFLVRLEHGGDTVILDPFARGAIRGRAELQRLLKSASGAEAELKAEHLAAAGKREILLRLLNNIKTRTLDTGDEESALNAVERMLLVTPDAPGLWFEAGALNGEVGRLHRARQCFETVVRLDPGGRLRPQADAAMGRLRRRLN